MVTVTLDSLISHFLYKRFFLVLLLHTYLPFKATNLRFSYSLKTKVCCRTKQSQIDKVVTE